MKYINPENLYDYGFLNEDSLCRPVRAVCVSFHGYTDATMFKESNETAKALGEKGIAWLFPYYSVWGWLGNNSLLFIEDVIDAAYERLGITDDVPFIVSGGSMGGLYALNYLMIGKRRAIGCALNCPVTDVERMFLDKPDVRRAILSAHIEKEGDLLEILRSYSPVNFTNQLPKIPYYIVFGESDVYFMESQMPPMREKLKESNLNYTLVTQPEMKHCDLKSHPLLNKAFCDFLISLPD